MTIRKNKKRIDPRYFLSETTYRDLEDDLPLNEASSLDPKAIMAAVEMLKASAIGQKAAAVAANDPKIMAAVEDMKTKASQAMTEGTPSLDDSLGGTAMFGMGSALAMASWLGQVGGATIGGAAGLFAAFAASPALAALGITTGVLGAALGVYIATGGASSD